MLSNGHTSLFDPCTISLHIKEKLDALVHDHHFPKANKPKDLFYEKDSFGEGVLQQTPHDDRPAMSVEDKTFLEIMDREVFMDDSNSWVEPHLSRNKGADFLTTEDKQSSVFRR